MDTTQAKKHVKRAGQKPQPPQRVWKSHQLTKKPPLTITGYSRAADKTFLHVPELKLGLDCGILNGRQPEVILLTHTHSDHSKDVSFACQREHGTTIYCPKDSVNFIDNYTRSEVNLNNCGEWWPSREWYKYKLIGVEGGDQFFLKKDESIRVTVVDCVHAVPCVGFCLEEKKSKLKEEYSKLPGKELGELRKKGVEVSEVFYQPMFVYLGDTSIHVFEKYPDLFRYPSIIVECTFFHKEDGIHERAERDGHIHWDALQDVILTHPKTEFILIHFSLRYKEAEIFEFFDNLVSRENNPLNLDNVTLFVGEHSNGSQL